jgi:hypothetical protein
VTRAIQNEGENYRLNSKQGKEIPTGRNDKTKNRTDAIQSNGTKQVLGAEGLGLCASLLLALLVDSTASFIRKKSAGKSGKNETK